MPTAQPDLLRGLSDDEASQVIALGSRVSLPSGGELFRLGAAADCVYVVERGRIALTLPIQVGGREEDVLVEERVVGQTVGWSGLIPSHRFTLRATAPLKTGVIALPRAALIEFFAAHPAAGTSSRGISPVWWASVSRSSKPCGCARCSAWSPCVPPDEGAAR